MQEGSQSPQTESAKSPNAWTFRFMVEKLPAAAYTCDAEGLITYFNRRAVELWGREPKINDPVDRYCGSFKLFSPTGSPIPHAECWMALALRDGKEYREQEIVIERPDGSRWIALAHANPFYDELGRIAGAVNVLVDITARKRAEVELQDADRRKNEFLAMLAHELRNPLAPLRNGLEIARLASNNSEVLAEAHAIMERQLAQMVRLVDDLLNLSRIANGKIELRKERIELATIVEDAVETSRSLIEAAGHTLAVTLPPTPVVVYADGIRLAQVFANLLNNSARYTDRGGHLWLTVEVQGNDVKVKVKDTGIGIPPDMLTKIFDMFTQANRTLEQSQGGLGIGLSLVRSIVEMHGGRVEAYSEGPGTGSEFIVHLSAVLSPSQEMQRPQGDEALHIPKCRILVVDDHKMSADSLAMWLKVSGHATCIAYDGQEGVETAKTFQPDVVLIDIGLPTLNGYDACRSIRAQPWSKGMVLIALSEWYQEEDKCKSKAAGFDLHLVKPVSPPALEKLLAELISPRLEPSPSSSSSIVQHQAD